MNKDASINDNGGAYTGLDRFVCREKLWSDMEGAGLTIKVDPHLQRVPRSQRYGMTCLTLSTEIAPRSRYAACVFSLNSTSTLSGCF